MTITLLDTRTQTAGEAQPGGLPVGGCSTPPRQAATRTISAPPVFVNGTEIMEEDIARELQHHPGEDVDTARAEAARALVIRHLLLERSHELALSPEPETDPLGRWESDEEALVRQVLEAEADPAEPSAAEIDRVIAANPPPAALSVEAARRAVADRLRARAWLGASTRYVAGLARGARIEGLTLFAEDG
jgi:peptidyl-prolyl cis-trans isomerase C